MSNNVAASMTASIVIDKSDILTQALKGIAQVQKELNDNKLELLFDVSDEKVTKKLKELQKQFYDKDYVIKFKNQGIEETLKSLDELFEKLKLITSGKAFGSGNGSGKGIGNSIVDEKTLNSVIDLFTKMESHLGEMKKVFADVGDGEEFSPLLKMINEVQESISKLAVSVSKIKLNLNLDLGSVNEEKVNTKISETNSRQLNAYRKLLDSMKKSKVSNAEMFKFFEPSDASVSELIGMYRNLFQRFEKDIFSRRNLNSKDIFKAEYKEIENARAAFNRATRAEAKTNPLGELFGGGTDLTEVITQLGLIVGKLDEISSVASEFKNTFKDGFNVTASVDEIEKLTNKVKELEEELSKLKTSSPTIDTNNETNISSSTKDTFQSDKLEKTVNSAKELDKTLEEVDVPTNSFDEVLSKLDLTKSKLGEIVKITKQGYANKDGKFVESYVLKDESGSTETYGASSHTENGQLLRYNYINDNTKALNEQRKAEKELQRQQQASDAAKQKEIESKKIAEQKEKYQELVNTINRYSTIKKRIAGGNALSSDIKEAEELDKKIKELHKQDILSDAQYRDVQLKLDNLKTSLKDIESLAKENKLDSLQSEIDRYTKTYNSFNIKPTNENRSNEYTQALNKYYDAISKLTAEKERLKNLGSPITEKELENWNTLTSEVDKALKEVREFSAAEKGSTEGSRLKLFDKISKYLKDNTKLSKQAREELEGYLKLLQSGDPSINVDKLNQAFLRVSGSERQAHREGKSFFDIFRDKALYGYAAQLAHYYLSLYDFIRYARNAINAVRELDTALVDFKKTTTMTASNLEDFYYDSNDVAKELGVTTKEIIEQASAWSRLGYSSKETSTEMAKLSSQFASVSPGMDLDVSTDGLVSSMKAFGIEVEDVERKIMDNINRIGNTAATSNDEIVDMLTRSSAAMAAANNTIEETIALETAAVEITRNAETTGTAFKTISMRLRGYDEETEELSDDLKNISGDIADLTKTASTPGGISLFTDESKETYKSTYQILKEISEIYDELSDKNRAELLEKLAGKRGGQVVAGLLTNFEAAEKAIKEMENAAGSADAEMTIVQESLDYKINALKETWVGTAQEMIERGDFGIVIDGLTKLSEAIGWVVDKAGLLGTIGLGTGIFTGIKNFGRPKMFGLCFEIAEYHKCSLGY